MHTHKPADPMNANLDHINDGDNRRRVVRDGVILGWVTKWYARDAVNLTGVPRFAAHPFCGGAGAGRTDCETYSAAVAYLIACRDA